VAARTVAALAPSATNDTSASEGSFLITISFHQSLIWQVLDQAAQFVFPRSRQHIACRAKVAKPQQSLLQGTEGVNLLIHRPVLLINPLHDLRAKPKMVWPFGQTLG
jgi:hypothetical protein